MRRRGEARRPGRGRPEKHPADLEGAGVVLDYFPQGFYADPHREHRDKPVAQAIGYRRFTLLDGVVLDEVDLLEDVALSRETFRTLVVPVDPVSGRVRRVTVMLACMIGIDKRVYCLPVQPNTRDIIEYVRQDLEGTDPRLIVLDRPEALRSVAAEKGLPEKILVVPRRTLRYDELSDLAKKNLEEAVAKIVRAREREFVEFFNIAMPINIRLHSLSLLKGIGKRVLMQIVRTRETRRFQSFDDIKRIIKSDPVEALVDKILEELRGEAKYYLFVKPPSPDAPFLNYLEKVEKSLAQRR